jgi:hypothetical protein
VRSMWRGTGEVLISLQISECVSRSIAHDQVIAELADFQSTDIRRDERDEFGDIAFVLPARTVALFARANLVVLVTNAGVEVVPVTDVAIAVDRWLTRRPSPGGTVVPEIQRLALYDGGPVTVGEPVGLDVQATDPLDRALRYEFWSRLGEVRVDDGTPVYLGHAVGTDELTVYAVNENAGVARATLPIEIGGGQTG